MWMDLQRGRGTEAGGQRHAVSAGDTPAGPGEGGQDKAGKAARRPTPPAPPPSLPPPARDNDSAAGPSYVHDLGSQAGRTGGRAGGDGEQAGGSARPPSRGPAVNSSRASRGRTLRDRPLRAEPERDRAAPGLLPAGLPTQSLAARATASKLRAGPAAAAAGRRRRRRRGCSTPGQEAGPRLAGRLLRPPKWAGRSTCDPRGFGWPLGTRSPPRSLSLPDRAWLGPPAPRSSPRPCSFSPLCCKFDQL